MKKINKKSNNKKRNDKAITLIALVITIVVLIILATVVINLSLGNNGILNRARTATEQYTNSQENEKDVITKTTDEFDNYTLGIFGSNREMVIKDLINKNDTAYNSTKGGYIIPIASGWVSRDITINLNEGINNYSYLLITYDRLDSNVSYNLQQTSIIETNSFESNIFVQSWGDGYARFNMIKENNSKLKINASGGSGVGINNISEIRITKIIGIK